METIEWVRNPNLAPNGLRDSKVFVSAVTAIFERSRISNLKKVKSCEVVQLNDKIRDLLTYLLLRRQPSTASPIPLDYPGMINSEDPERVAVLKACHTRMIERALQGEIVKPYATMQLLVEANLVRDADWVKGEELTLWILALSLFTTPVSPKDFYTVYRCLKLSTDSLAMATMGEEKEFAEDPLRIVSWVSTTLEQICELRCDTVQVVNDVAYICLFASMIRVSRMSEVDHPIQGLLRDEVMQLQEIRQNTGRVVKCSQ